LDWTTIALKIRAKFSQVKVGKIANGLRKMQDIGRFFLCFFGLSFFWIFGEIKNGCEFYHRCFSWGNSLNSPHLEEKKLQSPYLDYRFL